MNHVFVIFERKNFDDGNKILKVFTSERKCRDEFSKILINFESTNNEGWVGSIEGERFKYSCGEKNISFEIQLIEISK